MSCKAISPNKAVNAVELKNQIPNQLRNQSVPESLPKLKVLMEEHSKRGKWIRYANLLPHLIRQELKSSGAPLVSMENEADSTRVQEAPHISQSRSPSPSPAKLRVENKHLTRVSPLRSRSRGCSVSRSRRVFPDAINVGMDRETLERVYSADLRRWLIDQGKPFAQY